MIARDSLPEANDPRLTDEQYDEAWEIWSRAWDKARDADMAAGRRYDQRMYHDAAISARREYILACLERAT